MSRRALGVAVLALAGGVTGCAGGDDGDVSSMAETTSTASGTQVTSSPTAPVAPTAAQRAGARVVFPLVGTTPPGALLARLRRGEAAGVIFFARNIASPAQVRALTRRLRAAVPTGAPPPLLMVDQEGGPVKRLPGAPTRGAREIAATGRPSVARAEGAATARTLRAAGMNVDLAPVVDVVRPGSALAGEGRGFGSTPEDAGRFGAAFIEGLQDGGVAAAAKHFPGFGAAGLNTDDGPTTIDLSAATLRRTDRAPFRAATIVGVRMVMLSSAIYPALARVPAVLSRRIVTGELREGLGYEGVTISDDLQTPAFAAHGGATGAGLAAARAGVDLLLFAGGYTAAARATRALAAAIRRRAIPTSELDASAARIAALRETLR